MIDYLVAIVVVFSVGHFVRQVNMPWTDWVLSALLLIVCSTAFVAIGLALTLIQNLQLTIVVGNILYMGLAILGGLWMPITMFPDWMQTIGKMLPTYQLMQVLRTFLDKGTVDLSASLYLLVFSLFVFLATIQIQKRIEVK